MQGRTHAAVLAYDRLAKREHSAHKAEEELREFSRLIPQEDMEEYIGLTNNIDSRRTSACKACK